MLSYLLLGGSLFSTSWARLVSSRFFFFFFQLSWLYTKPLSKQAAMPLQLLCKEHQKLLCPLRVPRGQAGTFSAPSCCLSPTVWSSLQLCGDFSWSSEILQRYWSIFRDTSEILQGYLQRYWILQRYCRILCSHCPQSCPFGEEVLQWYRWCCPVEYSACHVSSLAAPYVSMPWCLLVEVAHPFSHDYSVLCFLGCYPSFWWWHSFTQGASRLSCFSCLIWSMFLGD